MQLPPLDFTDASLLLAISAIILLITAELFSSSSGLTDLTLNKRLKNAAIASSILFMATVAIRIIGIIVGT